MRKILLIVSVFFLSVFTLTGTFAATKTSTSSGNWNNASIWNPYGVPRNNDDVIIATGTIVTVNINTASLSTLTIQTGAVLQGDGTGKILNTGRAGGQNLVNLGTIDAIGVHSFIIRLASASQWSGTGTYNLSQINLNSRTLSFTAGVSITLNLAGAPDPFLNPGSVVPSTTVTFNFNGSAAQDLTCSADISLNNLVISNPAGVTLKSNLTTANFLGNLSIASDCILNTANGTSAFNITGTPGKTLTLDPNSKLVIGSGTTTASSFPTGFSTYSIDAGSTIEYANNSSAVQNVSVGTSYGNITLSGTGMIAIGSGTLSVKGNWLNNSSGMVSINAGSSILMNGTSVQSIGGLSAITFEGLGIDNSSGVTLGTHITVNGTLGLTSGTITTGSYTATVASSGTVNRVSGHIHGNLEKYISTGTTSVIFEIGDASIYSPIDLNFDIVSTAGNLTTTTTASDHPNLSTSSIDNLNSVNRYWTLTGDGTLAAQYGATFHYTSTDIDAGADPNIFVVDQYNTSTWNAPVTGIRTMTSTEAIGLIAFGDFAVGKIKTYNIVASAGVHGTIAPSGTVVVKHGYDQSFTITPDANYHVEDVIVDGGSVGAVTNYTFTNVKDNYTISATFSINTYTLTVSATNGSVAKVPDQPTYDHGTSVELTATADPGYHFIGWSGDASGSDNPLTIVMDGNKSITANFAINTYTISVSAVNGSVAKVPDQPTYDHGTSVELTATADLGYHFTGWSGDASGSDNPLTIVMDGNKSITANFAINTYTLSISAVNGSVTKVPDQPTYDHGTSVELTPTADPGYHFTGWSGDASGSDNPLTIVMDGNKNITAIFAINTYTLSISAVNGSVAKNPDQPLYNHGSSVELTATADPGYHFTGWSGDASGSDNPLTVVMDGNKSITANFAINTYTLSVSAVNGSVAKVFDQPTYDHGTSVELTATADPGYHFTGWSGDASGSDNPLTIVMDGNKSISANFAINTYTLSISAVNGSVAKVPDQPTYDHGTSVDLTPTADPGYHFTGWSGDASGSDNPLTVVMDGNKSITANFAINTYTLSVSAVNGSVTKVPDQPTYDHGTSVELTPTADPGYHFTGWSGDASGSDNPLTVLMGGNKSITANFAINTYTLNVSAANGSVAKDPDQPTYNHGTSVNLTATPDAGYHFTGWSGSASGNNNPLTVVTDSNRNISANFVINTYTLNISATNGTVVKDPDQAIYTHGTCVNLTAIPSVGWIFTGWSGDVPAGHGSDNPLTITVLDTTSLTAEFVYGVNTFQVHRGWNMISLPCRVADPRKLTLFPQSISDASAYDTHYILRDTLVPGIGYWLKFGAAETVVLSGIGRQCDSFEVKEGWNMIGSISEPFPVGSITSEPPGLVTSQFFRFEGRYDIVDTIKPGTGYWVKVSQAGHLILTSSSSAEPKNVIKIVADKETPPPPPIDGFNSDSENRIPSDFLLYQNYPNPFNPSTTIEFELPQPSFVTIQIYNMLGQEVQTVLDRVEFDEGTDEIEFVADNLASGVYFYRLTAEKISEESTAMSFSQVKRMILVK